MSLLATNKDIEPPDGSHGNIAHDNPHSEDARIHWFGNPQKALPIYRSRLQNEANHKCIAGVEQ